MKLVNCHIENFGKLSDFDMDFSDGTNTVNEDNGYGKSTLSSFLRIMLYGFDNENKRDETVNERLRYKPWQGGVYGGSMTIEVDSRMYIITRTFGNKESEDFFEVRDAGTLIVSDEYGKNIGEQLFGIDSDSFKRSVMISQNDCETRSTDGINAKLGNLTETTDDISNFENVDEQLKKAVNSLSDTKKTGSRYKIKGDIYNIENELRARINIENQYENALVRLNEEKNKLDKLNDRLKVINGMENDEAVNKGLYLIKERYEKLKLDIAQTEAELKNDSMHTELLCEVFRDGVPDDDKFNEVSSRIAELNDVKMKQQADNLSFTELEDYRRLSKVFDGKENPSQELDEAIINIRTYEDECRHCADLSKQIERMNFDENAPENKSLRNISIVGLVLGALPVIVSAVIYIRRAENSLPITVIGIAGFIMMIAFAISLMYAMNTHREYQKRKTEYNDLLIQLEEANGNRNHIRKSIVTVISRYGIQFDNYDIGRRVSRLRDDYDYYSRLCERGNIKGGESLRIVIAEKTSMLDLFFKRYERIITGTEYYEKLYSLKAEGQYYNIYNSKKDKLKLLCDELAGIEARDDFEGIQASHNPETANVTERSKEYDKVMEEIDKVNGLIEDYRRMLEGTEEMLDELNLKEGELSRLKNELDEQNDRARIYELTRQYLNNAKTSFLQKYSAPITNNFRKYLQILDGNDSTNYSFDANTNLCVNSGGKIRKPEVLSRGMRDLAGIAFRMSLIEAMFEGEKPYIIMDDPFVNLDDLRMKGAMKLIDNISHEYQVIYFTCSSSRVPFIESE